MRKNEIGGYFDLNRSQRRSLLILLTLFLVGILISNFYKRESTVTGDSEVLVLNEKLKELELQMMESPEVEVQSFYFDPNTLSRDSLILLGLSPKVAERVVKYRKYYRFQQPDDLSKIYGLSDSSLTDLRPWIRIGRSGTKPVKRPLIPDMAETIKPIDMNLSDSTDWATLKGIGPVLSARIIKYRNALGGFISVTQLREVYGIDEDLYQKLVPFVLINEINVSPLMINDLDWRGLVRHPYISREMASEIMNYRRSFGRIENMDELKASVFSDTVSIESLKSYLEF